jgi:anti-anti-sigma factor
LAVDFTTARYGRVSVLRPSGRITNENAPEFQKLVSGAANEADAGMLVLDLAALDYISSGGLRAVASGSRICRDRGGQLMVSALTSVVQEIFAISRFHQVVTVKSSLPEALGELSSEALADFEARK